MENEDVKSTEYPKSLYQGGDRDAEHAIVNNDAEEVTAREAGFKMIDKDADKASVARLAADPEDAPAEKPSKARAKKS